MADNKLLMAFIGINDSPDFVRGFESGQMWSKMEKGEKFENYLFHTTNKKQVEMMCKRFLYKFRIEQIEPEWSILIAELSESVN